MKILTFYFFYKIYLIYLGIYLIFNENFIIPIFKKKMILTSISISSYKVQCKSKDKKLQFYYIDIIL